MTIIDVYPKDGAVNVPLNQTIKVTFDKEPDMATLLDSMYSLTANNESISLTISIDGNSIYFAPEELKANTKYTFFLSNMDILSGAQFKSVEGDALDSGITIRFVTAAQIDIDLDLSDYYYGDFKIEEKPQYIGSYPKRLLTSNTVAFIYSSNITNANQVVVTIEQVDGNIEYQEITPQIDTNKLIVTFTEAPPKNSIVTFQLPEVETEKGTVEARSETFITPLYPTLLTIHLLEYRLGQIKKELNDMDIYFAMLDQYIELEAILKRPILGQDISNNFGNYQSAVRKFLQAQAMWNIIQSLLARKAVYGGDNISTNGTNMTIGQIRTAALDLFRKEKEQALQELEALIDSLRPPLNTTQRGAETLKQKLYYVFEDFRWNQVQFGQPPMPKISNSEIINEKGQPIP